MSQAHPSRCVSCSSQATRSTRPSPEGFAAAGCIGGFVTLRGGQCDPFRYVMPAASPDAHHVAWYSDTFAPEGSVTIERAGAIVGRRDGKPFVHCHGIWNTQEGMRMGHLLAPDTMVTEPVEAIGIGLKTATFEGLPDPETNFTLFEPVEVAEEPDERGRCARAAGEGPSQRGHQHRHRGHLFRP